MGVIKKIFKTFLASFLGAYLSYLIYFTIIFLQGSEPLFGNNFANFITEAIFIALVPLMYAPIITIILLIASLIEKRVLSKWLIFIFGFYFSIVLIASITLPIQNIWLQFGLVLFPLVITIGVMKIKDGLKKSNPSVQE